MDRLVYLLLHINEWYWFGFAVILVIFEVLLGANFFLLWLAISACAVGVFKLFLPALGGEWQLLIFALESIACLIWWNVHLKNMPNTSDQPNLNRRSEQYIGRTITLNEAIVNGRGKVHVDDSFWRIEGPDLPAGTSVKVIGVDGVVLKVAKV
jgi:membrane protein implicated in regulation of membrane protease activity